jgi:Uma2 family endonuclease
MQIQDRLRDPKNEEKLVTLYGVSWTQFKNIEANLTNVRAVNLTYLRGVLEIMSPISDDHETVKSTLGALLEAYMRIKNIRHYRRGGFTLEAEGYASGTPDESYSIGTRRQWPDLVIEVIITSGSINRKALYLPLKIPEVWFWQAGKIRIFQLQENQYQETEASQFFPELNIALLLRYIEHPDQYDAVQDFLTEVKSSQ